MKRFAASALLLAAACDPGFEPQYRVTDLRILGVRAEVVGSEDEGGSLGNTRADVSPGDTLQLEALVANPRGRAGLTVRWFACAPTGTDALPPCADEAFLRDPEALVGTPGVLELPRGERPPAVPLSLLEEERPGLVAAVLAAVRQRAAVNPTFQCSPYVEIPLVVVAQAEGRREVALKRVRLAAGDAPPGYVRNRNPRVLGVVPASTDPRTCSGALDPAAPFPGGRTVLCPQTAPGDAEEYADCGPNGPLEHRPRESLSWQWFVTAGEFPEEGDGIGNATGHDPEFERPAGPFTLWVVLRDGRGGESWVRRDVAAAP